MSEEMMLPEVLKNRGITIAPFKPMAYFDAELDCIRVQIRDCSIAETRVNRWLTILEDNHPDEDQYEYVGFTLKGITHLFKEIGLPMSGVVEVREILRALIQKQVEDDPDATVKWVVSELLYEKIVEPAEKTSDETLAVNLDKAA